MYVSWWRKTFGLEEEGATPAHASFVTTVEDLRLLFERCAEQSTAGLLVLDEGEAVHQIRFAAVTEYGLMLDLPLDIDEAAWAAAQKALTPCSVVFFTGVHSRFFVSHVADTESLKREGLQLIPPKLLLRFPRFVAGTESRMSFRIPIVQDADLAVSLVCPDSESWAAEPLDLSQTGALLQFSHNEDPGLSLGDEVKVRIQLGRHAAELHGVIRRAEKRQYGVHFPDTVRGTDLSTPEALQDILDDLERRWLKERRRGEGE